ncbi:MAG: hypothetical protein NTY19_42170 [Planctomycetota bacterium]|nr:hypothetical protein [Planctomycetota bacterium]
MIHFDPVSEPREYAAAHQAGLQWLEQHPPASRPRDYWSQLTLDGLRAKSLLIARAVERNSESAESDDASHWVN